MVETYSRKTDDLQLILNRAVVSKYVPLRNSSLSDMDKWAQREAWHRNDNIREEVYFNPQKVIASKPKKKRPLTITQSSRFGELDSKLDELETAYIVKLKSNPVSIGSVVSSEMSIQAVAVSGITHKPYVDLETAQKFVDATKLSDNLFIGEISEVAASNLRRASRFDYFSGTLEKKQIRDDNVLEISLYNLVRAKRGNSRIETGQPTGDTIYLGTSEPFYDVNRIKLISILNERVNKLEQSAAVVEEAKKSAVLLEVARRLVDAKKLSDILLIGETSEVAADHSLRHNRVDYFVRPSADVVIGEEETPNLSDYNSARLSKALQNFIFTRPSGDTILLGTSEPSYDVDRLKLISILNERVSKLTQSAPIVVEAETSVVESEKVVVQKPEEQPSKHNRRHIKIDPGTAKEKRAWVYHSPNLAEESDTMFPKSVKVGGAVVAGLLSACALYSVVKYAQKEMPQVNINSSSNLVVSEPAKVFTPDTYVPTNLTPRKSQQLVTQVISASVVKKPQVNELEPKKVRQPDVVKTPQPIAAPALIDTNINSNKSQEIKQINLEDFVSEDNFRQTITKSVAGITISLANNIIPEKITTYNHSNKSPPMWYLRVSPIIFPDVFGIVSFSKKPLSAVDAKKFGAELYHIYEISKDAKDPAAINALKVNLEVRDEFAILMQKTLQLDIKQAKELTPQAMELAAKQLGLTSEQFIEALGFYHNF